MYSKGLAAIYIFSSGHVRCRAPVPLGRIPPPPRFVYDRDKFSNHEQSETNKKMKMQCEAVYPNSYECVSDYMENHHNRF